MNKEQKAREALHKRAMIMASGQVLCDILPEDYDTRPEVDEDGDGFYIDEWIVENAWAPYENWSAKELWQQIDCVATTLIDFHKKEMEQGQ